ncbi:MAG: transposase family protein [Tannerellaceae bacterium]|jgi:hypothetical protein|nr:transposase family protein [Tannerellaceae bacterium]
MSYFATIRDPRVERTREHDLDDILFIAIASIICGAESWYEMEEFGKAKVTMFALDTRRDGCSRPLPLGVPRAMSIWRLK